MKGVNKAGSGQQHAYPGLPELKNPTGRNHNKEDRRSMRMKMTRAAAAAGVAASSLLAGCGGATPPEPSPSEPVQITAAEARYPQLTRETWAGLPLETKQNFCQTWTESVTGPESIRSGWFTDQWALSEEDQRINTLMWDAFMDVLNEECR